MPAIRGFKVYCELEERTVSIHERLEDAISRANALAVADHVRFEVLNQDGEQLRPVAPL